MTEKIDARRIMPPKLANIGCGTIIHPTWENYDLLPSSPGVTRINLLRGLPLADAVYDGIYCSHVLEHLPRQRVIGVLREFRRALRPDGILRVVVPDLEVIAELYLKELRAALDGDQSAADRHEWMCMELLDQMTRSFSGGFMGRLLSSRPLNSRGFVQGRIGQEGRVWLESVDPSTALDPNLVYDVPDTTEKTETKFRSSGELHRWMYDRLSLGRLLREAGFARIKVCGPDESAIHGFTGFGLDTDEKGAVRKPDSLFMEATAIAAGDKSDQAGQQ